MKELGVQMIPAYSPQARGRSERSFGTWQGRLPQELRLAAISGFTTACKCLSALRIRPLGTLGARSMRTATSLWSATRTTMFSAFNTDLTPTVSWKHSGRLGKFGLELHPDKTRLIEFGRFAAQRRQLRKEGKPATFDFLGFTHISGEDRNGNFVVKRQTIGKRLRSKLEEIKQQLRHRMHDPPALTGKCLKSVVQGYFNYHAVPGNTDSLRVFSFRVTRLWRQVLIRRSQRHYLNWARMRQLEARWIPIPRVLHPWPRVRFDAIHPR